LSIRLQVGWVIDLINAVYFIHQKKVKHRDIKADNLLVFSELKVKLCDFGLSKQHSQSRVSSIVGGTQGFMAPEVVAGEGSGFPSDIFSWAMTFYQIVMREYPKVALSHSQLMGNLLVELEDKFDGVDLGPISSLLSNCIHKNPDFRPDESFADMVFLKDNGKPYDPNEDNDLWNAVLAKYNSRGPRIRGHALRHVAATKMADAGVSRDVAMAILGHESEAISFYYGRMSAKGQAAQLGTYGESISKRIKPQTT
jgi:serine/threonine protein kinase